MVPHVTIHYINYNFIVAYDFSNAKVYKTPEGVVGFLEKLTSDESYKVICESNLDADDADRFLKFSC